MTVLKSVKINSDAWKHPESHVQLTFPESWEISECHMAGHTWKELTDAEIETAVKTPIGSKQLSEIASGKKTATVIFDDLTRPTPAYKLVHPVLNELRKGGIRDENINFMAALGAHGTMIREDFVVKLGEDIVENYDIFNHNVYDHFIEKGTTSYGTPVELNRQVAEADVKVGIGGIKPHGFAGYGGGAKAILPGVVSLKTIETNHLRVASLTAKGQAGYGVMAKNLIRLDMEETARLAGLDFKVDVLMKMGEGERKVTGVFSGDFVQEHRAGVSLAKNHYATVPKTADIVVTNTYPQEDEGGIALWAANAALKEGGDVVIVQNAWAGQTHHFVYGQFGTNYGGHLGRFPRDYSRMQVAKAKRVIVLSKYFNKKDMHAKSNWVKTWDEAAELLKQDFGEKASVSIFPYGSVQHPPFPPDY